MEWLFANPELAEAADAPAGAATGGEAGGATQQQEDEQLARVGPMRQGGRQCAAGVGRAGLLCCHGMLLPAGREPQELLGRQLPTRGLLATRLLLPSPV